MRCSSPCGRQSSSPSKAVLKLEGVQTNGAPGASASVYLTAEGGAARAFVEIISFFASVRTRRPFRGAGRDLSFDVSAQFQQLSAGGSGGEDVSVVLAASEQGLVGDSAPVGQETYREAGLTDRKNLSRGPIETAGVIDLR